MKHFVINITYKVSLGLIDKNLEDHREFLEQGYEQGYLLCSGPQNPRIGGIIIARANSLDELRDFFSKDPYLISNLADYEFIEFHPVKYNKILTKWIDENPDDSTDENLYEI